MWCRKCGKKTNDPYRVGLSRVAGVALTIDTAAVLCVDCEENFKQQVLPKFQKLMKQWLK